MPEQDCVEPSFSITKYIKKPKDDPEKNKKKPKDDEKEEEPKTPSPPLLNSFYLGDLLRTKRAFKDGMVGKAFRQYIGDIPSPDVEDLLQNEALLSSLLKPDNTPAGRWPSAGRHPLVLMQQTAVNIATTTLHDGGLFSVNGPPGTGKTTLLRDIIASVIIDRAKALSSYKHPKDAFHKKGGLYELDAKLKGHEIFIASSNNNAV